ncbi:MAG: tetratricopeptide repeat protein [candidate division KSB1 bacterium]
MKRLLLFLLALALCRGALFAQTSNLSAAQEALRNQKFEEAIALLQEEVQRNSGSGEAHHYLGLALWQSGKAEAAYAELKFAREKDAKSGDYLEAFGMLCVELKKYEEAKTAFNDGLRLKNGKARFLYGLGLAYMGQDSLDRASVFLLRAREAEPQDARIYRGLAEVYGKQKITTMAMDNYREALKLDPDWAEGHYTLGKILQKEKQYNDALVEFKEVVRLAPQHREAYFDLGNLFFAGKKYVEAVAALESFVVAQPNSFAGHMLLAKALYATRQPVAAIGATEKAVALNPESAEALRFLANLYYDNRDYEHAATTFERFSRSAKNGDVHTEDHVKWGRSLMRLKQNAAAITQFEKAVSLDSTLADVYFDLGTLLVMEKRYAQAIPCFDKKTHVDATASGAYFNQGIAYIGLSDWLGAIRALKAGLALKPEHMEGRLALARSFAQVDSTLQAEAQYEEVLKLEPKHAEALKQVGYYNLIRKNYVKAVSYLRKHVELEPKSEYGWLWLAQGSALNRQIHEAKTAYQRVLQINPKNADAQKGLELLEQYE